jgi:hypothetical protein
MTSTANIGATMSRASFLLPLLLFVTAGAVLASLLIRVGGKIPYASFNTPITDEHPSRTAVLALYPRLFVVDMDDGHRKTVAAHHFMSTCPWYPAAACAVRSKSINCVCIPLASAKFPFETLRPLPVVSLNTVVPRNPDNSEPTTEEVLKYYPPVFAVDWEEGKIATQTAADVGRSCLFDETTCDVGEGQLYCVCFDGSRLPFSFNFDPYLERNSNLHTAELLGSVDRA